MSVKSIKNKFVKKFFPYILMLTILAGILSPFSLSLKPDNTLIVQKNEASAEFVYGFYDENTKQSLYFKTYEECETERVKIKEESMCMSIEITKANSSFENLKIDGNKLIYDISVEFDSVSKGIYNYWKNFSFNPSKFTFYKTEDVFLERSTLDNTFIDKINIIDKLSFDEKTATYSGKNLVWEGFEYNKSYLINIEVNQTNDFLSGGFTKSESKQIQIDFKDKDYKQIITQTIIANNSAESFLPACSFVGIATLSIVSGDGTFTGCIAQGLYYAVFVPTSWLFGFAGQFFDWVFDYSLDDASYTSAFVTEGWKIVRDICNVFFIFILLYVAISMILDLGGAKSKQMIVNIIIIGLLINFSMFFAKVIIDSSNILTRVFYNSEAIKEKTAGNRASTIGGFELANKEGDEISLSAGIVSQVNPQNIVRHASKVATVSDGGVVSGREATDSLTGSGFILVTLLAILVNLVGIFVFISVALVFIGRVIGLWFAMIFAPFAFLSYIVPAMSSIKMIGWKNWWSDLIALSFVAPLFMFMMYLLILFLGGETFGDLIDPNNNGSTFILKTIVSFAFIMIMLMTAKKMAKEYSGSIGKTVTGAVTAGGAMLLGAGVAGVALAGRKTVGSVAKYTQNDTARGDALKFKDAGDAWKKANWNPASWVSAAGKTVSGVGKFATAGTAQGLHAVGWGKKMQEEDAAYGKKQHAEHALNEKTSEMSSKLGLKDKDTKYSELTEPQQKEVRDSVNKDIIGKKVYRKKFDSLNAEEASSVENALSTITTDAKTGKIDFKIDAILKDPDDPNKLKTQKGKEYKEIEAGDAFAQSAKSNQAMGEFIRALRQGSYNLNNLSQAKFANKGMAKTGVAMIAGIAAGVRMGMKSSGINQGKGEKNFFDDLKNTVTDALKSVKIEVPKGGGGGGDSHGGGGGGGTHH